MLVTKSFLVVGETIHRNNKPEKNIPERVDAAVNEFLRGHEQARLVDIKPNVQISPTQDTAFIMVVLDVPEPPKEKKAEANTTIVVKKK